MIGSLFERDRNCIQCGNKVKSPWVQLSDQTYIDQQCLDAVRTTFSNGTAQEDMLQYYQYIMSMIVVCQKCNSIIDGCIRKKAFESNSVATCTLCSPSKKQIQKPPEHCSLCDKQFNYKVPKDNPVEIEGLKICHKCFTYQIKGLEETKEKEEKPDFGEFALRGKQKIFMEQKKQQSLKRPEIQFKPSIHKQEFKPQFKCKLGSQKKNQTPLFSSNIPPIPVQAVQADDQQAFDLFSISADLFNESPKQKKQELIKCTNCQQFLKVSQFDQKLKIVKICKVCHNKNSMKLLPKQPIKPSTQDFGLELDHLFDQEPFEFLQPLKVEQPKRAPLPLADEQKAVGINLDSYNYDLKGCKICFNATSSMINNKCRHLMMCEQCFNSFQTRRGITNGTMPCPYCNTKGKYSKYIEPIYI